MERKGTESKSVEPCETDKFKSNCEPEKSAEIEVQCTNISNAKCVGILAEKIFDCVYLDVLQFSDKDEVFAIDNFCETETGKSSYYRVGDCVCIDDISLCYDNIGIKDDDTIRECDCCDHDSLGEGNILVRYDMTNKVFTAVPGTEVEVDNIPDLMPEESIETSRHIPYTVNLYDEFESSVTRCKCNGEQGEGAIPKSRVFKQGVRYFVNNLKVRIRGRIGDKPFTATKDYLYYGDVYGCGPKISVNPVEITKKDTLGNGEGCGFDVGLNFTPINLYGRVSVPNDRRTVKSNIKLELCLSAECIETSERYGDYGEGYIRAIVGYSFLVNHNMRHTTSEELAVFTNPKGIECHDTSRKSDCVEDKDETNGKDTCKKPNKCKCKK